MTRRHRLAALVFAAVCCAASAAAQTPAPPAGPPQGCEQFPNFRLFDFWIGDWDVTPAGIPAGAAHPQSRVEKLLGGCLLLENWLPVNGPGGKSFNTFNRATKHWEQTWVDGGGNTSHLVGDARDGNMYFTSDSFAPNGTPQKTKLTFFNLAPGRVRQVWEFSADSGKTWAGAFDGLYVRK